MQITGFFWEILAQNAGRGVNPTGSHQRSHRRRTHLAALPDFKKKNSNHSKATGRLWFWLGLRLVIKDG